MSLYHITLLVTAAQEEAITSLFKEKCWEYLKTGQEQYSTDFSNVFKPETDTDDQHDDSTVKDEGQENMYEENAFDIVKREAIDSFDEQDTALQREIREHDEMSSQAIQDSMDASYQAVQIQMLQETEADRDIVETNLTKPQNLSEKQCHKKTMVRKNKAKFKSLDSSYTDIKEHLPFSNILPTSTAGKPHNIQASKASGKECTGSDNINNEMVTTSNHENTDQPLEKDTDQASLKIYKCDICNKAYEIYGRLVRHRIIHSQDSEKTYRHECSKCGESFIRKNQLAKHMTTHNREDQTVYQCELCGRSYTRKQDLQFHNDTVHSVDARFNCEHCGRSFTSARFLKIHTVKQTCTKLYTCQICGDSFPRLAPLTKHRMKHYDKEHNCTVCGQIFANDSSLRRHMFQHSDTMFKCDFCEKTFKTPYALKDHVVVHTREKRHICDVCGEAYGHSSGLRLHKMKHTGQKPYTCTTCGKSFPTSSRLRGHSFVHGEIELHKCHLCKNVFRKQENLLKHILTHTESNTETLG